MSLEFVSGALFAFGLMLIGQWLRDRWRYRRATSTALPPRPFASRRRRRGRDDLVVCLQNKYP